MSLWKNMKNKKLNTLVMASLLAVSLNTLFSNNAFADRYGYLTTPDFSSSFSVWISDYNDGMGDAGNDGQHDFYLYWCANDETYYAPYFQDGSYHDAWTTLTGGNWYLLERYTSYYTTDRYFTLLGSGGMSEDELQQALDDKFNGDVTIGSGGVDEDGDGTPDRPGDLNVAGDGNIDGDGNVGGDMSIGKDGVDTDGNGEPDRPGNLEVAGNSDLGGDANVGYDGVDEDGDGEVDRPGDLNVAGNGNIYGNLNVSGDSNLTGDTIVGDRDDEGNVTDYSDLDVTGDANLGGDTEVGFDGVDEDGDGTADRYGDLDVAGNTTVGIRDEQGNVEQASDLDVTGNSNLGGDTNIGYDGVDEDGDGTADRPGDLNVAGDSNLTGDTIVGSRDEDGAVVDRSDLDVTGNANLGGDTYVGFDGVDDDGNGVPDRPGNMYIAGDTVIGVPGVPGAESNLHVTGSTNIDHDLYVGGEGHFGGNLYAPDLIFNGGKSLTGEISRLDNRIDTAGANAAALAGLHPLDFDEDQKLNFAAAVGSYQGASAMALGMFYRPDDRTMFNLGGTFGNRENMATLGISFALDGPNAVKRSSKKQMQEQIVMLTAANAEMAEDNAEMQAELAELKAMVMELKAEQTAESK